LHNKITNWASNRNFVTHRLSFTYHTLKLCPPLTCISCHPSKKPSEQAKHLTGSIIKSMHRNPCLIDSLPLLSLSSPARSLPYVLPPTRAPTYPHSLPNQSTKNAKCKPCPYTSLSKSHETSSTLEIRWKDQRNALLIKNNARVYNNRKKQWYMAQPVHPKEIPSMFILQSLSPCIKFVTGMMILEVKNCFLVACVSPY
jgi:hypothetical protein